MVLAVPPAVLLSPNIQLKLTICPSGSSEPDAFRVTLNGAVPDTGLAISDAAGGRFGVPGGSTSRVTLCAGTLVESKLPLYPTSASRAIMLVEVSCQTCAKPLPEKLEIDRFIGVLPLRTLLITITVNAPSDVRTAANDE